MRLFSVGPTSPVAFAAEMEIDRAAERAYLYEHAWRQAKRKFYDPKLHGVDWDGMRDAYAPFLPHINNNHDVDSLCREFPQRLQKLVDAGGGRIGKRVLSCDASFLECSIDSACLWQKNESLAFWKWLRRYE